MINASSDPASGNVQVQVGQDELGNPIWGEQDGRAPQAVERMYRADIDPATYATFGTGQGTREERGLVDLDKEYAQTPDTDYGGVSAARAAYASADRAERPWNSEEFAHEGALTDGTFYDKRLMYAPAEDASPDKWATSTYNGLPATKFWYQTQEAEYPPGTTREDIENGTATKTRIHQRPDAPTTKKDSADKRNELIAMAIVTAGIGSAAMGAYGAAGAGAGEAATVGGTVAGNGAAMGATTAAEAAAGSSALAGQLSPYLAAEGAAAGGAAAGAGGSGATAGSGSGSAMASANKFLGSPVGKFVASQGVGLAMKAANGNGGSENNSGSGLMNSNQNTQQQKPPVINNYYNQQPQQAPQAPKTIASANGTMYGSGSGWGGKISAYQKSKVGA